MKVVFSCGRVNPPTTGHQRVVDRIHELVDRDGGVPLIFLTKTHDAKRNPLSPEEKVRLVERAFATQVRLTTSPFTAVEQLVEDGVGEATLVVGQDRVGFRKSLVEYSATIGLKLNIETLTRTEADVSATRARQAVLESDFSTFMSLVPAPDAGFAMDLYRAVGLGLEDDAYARRS